MTQPKFLVHRGKGRYYQSDHLRVAHREINRPKGKPFGGMQFVEGTGKYQPELTILASRGPVSVDDSYETNPLPLNANGTKTSDHHGQTVPPTAAGVKKVARRIRPVEAQRLDEVDDQIEALQAQVRALRATRAELVALAWSKAHVVTLKEVTPSAVGKGHWVN